MGLELTKNAILASQKVNLEPLLVLEVDGVPTRYGVRIIQKRTRIGDEGLKVGGGWKIGGMTPLPDQSDLITLEGTTTSIRQLLQPDKGASSSISSMQIALVDKDLEATELISPGIVIEDILGRKAKVYLGVDANSTAFPDDYIAIFRGIIDDIQARAGTIVLNLAHPDQKKRQQLFPKMTTNLSADIAADSLVAIIDSAKDFVFTSSYPDHLGLQTYVKIDDEYIEYRSIGPSREILVNLVRGQFGTTPKAHLGPHTDSNGHPVEGAPVETFYRLRGNVIDLALKLMLSDPGLTPYAKNVSIGSFVWVDPETKVDQGIFFRGVDLVERYGVSVGDVVRTFGATNGANNITVMTSKVTEIIKRYDGTIIVVSGSDFQLVEERTTAAYAEFTSYFNCLGVGLGMSPDEVDIAEHLRIKRLFLPNFEVDLYIHDTTNVKELIEQELYSVAGAHSVPRKSKSSVGLHIGPIPGTNTVILSADNIKNPSKIQVRRSLNTNFYNTMIYKIDQELETEEFTKGIVTTSEDSLNRIKVGTKAQVVEAKGLRSYLNGETQATQASNRKLARYKYGAEYIDNLEVFFKTGLAIEIGDIVLLDPTGLQIVNTKNGTRNAKPKLWEVVNKQIDLRTGNIVLSIVDTGFSTNSRYGLISPSSRIKIGTSQTEFVIEAAFSREQYGDNESLKWKKFLQATSTVAIKVRSPDFTARFAQTVIADIQGNTIKVRDPLGFVPQPGDIMELANYSYSETTEQVKLLYAFMNASNFPDGTSAYRML